MIWSLVITLVTHDTWCYSPRDRRMVSWRPDVRGLPGPEGEVVMVMMMFLMAILLLLWSGGSSHHIISRSICGEHNQYQQSSGRQEEGEHQDDKSRCSLILFGSSLPRTLSVNLQTMSVHVSCKFWQYFNGHIIFTRTELNFENMKIIFKMPWTINVRALILILIRNVDILAP